ncbi:MAG: MFS transporter [Herpetosiphon sp.]
MVTFEQHETGTIVRPRVARLAVATIFFTNGLLLANWFARVPDVKQRLDLSAGTLSLALLSAAVGSLLAQPTAGWAIGRMGSRPVTAVIALAFCGVFVLPGFATTLPILMLVLCLFGALNGALDVAMNAQAALVERQYGRSIMNSFHALWSVGGLVGAAFGGLAATRGMPLAAHFLIAAGAGALCMLIALRGLVPDRGANVSHDLAFALPPRVLLPMGLVAFSALVCEGAIGDWGALYLREGLRSPPGVAATGYAVFALLMAAGRFTGDWLTMRFGAGRLVRASGVLVLAGISLALVSTSPWIAIVGFGLIGAGVSCIFPLIMSAAARTPGIAPGIGIAAMATAGYTGFLVGPPLIGSVAEIASLRSGLGVLALFGLVIVRLGATVAISSRPHAEAVAG